MADNFDSPIIIGSDDESDSDDVVIIKEEIEVDCDDVIFLSETRPEQISLHEDQTVKINETVITSTKHLTIEDNSQVLFSESIGATNARLIPDSVGPLDLSTKPDDLSAKQDQVSCRIDQKLHKSSKFAADSNSILSEVTNPHKPLCTLLLSGVQDKWQACQDLVPKLDTVYSNKNAVNDMLKMNTGVSDLNSSLCSSSAGTILNQNNIYCKPTDDALRPSSSTSNCTCHCVPLTKTLLGSSVLSGTDSSHSTNSSLDSFKTHNVSLVLTPVSDVFTTSNSMHGSSMCYQQQKSSSDLTNNDCSSHYDNKCFTDSLSVLSKSNIDTNSLISNSLSAADDPFYKSHKLLSSLDQMCPSYNSTPSTTSSNTTSPADGSQLSSQQCGSASVQIGTSSASHTLPVYSSGLLGGSSSSCQRQDQRSAITNACTKDSQLSTYILKRSMSSETTCLYNPLTLQLSMQNHQFRRSVSTSGFSTDHAVSQSSTRSISPAGVQKDVISSSPYSGSQWATNGSHHLPPKKQKRCYSDSGQASMCTNCSLTLVGEKYSRCPNGHVTCTKCLEDRVKLVLTGKAKESVKCLNNSCDSFYPISELRQSLPSMVVEILEDKLDQDYVNFISDMILKNVSEEMDAANNMDQDGITSRIDTKYIKKYEDCPGHWNLMDERLVTKNGYVDVKLEPGSSEYEDVVARFFESMIDQNVEVTCVHRIQNPILWKYYTVKKTEMIQDNEGFGSVIEGQLFHGTASQAAEAICRKGFDWRLCGKHGTMYGQGSYFAVNASYSHQYTDLRHPQVTIQSPVTFQPPPSVISIPNPQSLPFPTANVNFCQTMNPMSGMSTCPLSGMPISQYRPMNLSHMSPMTGNQLTAGKTSTISQPQKTSYVWPSPVTSIAISSSSNAIGSGLILNSAPTGVQSSTMLSSLLASGVNSPSTSSGMTQTLKSIMPRSNLIPKPLMIRHVSGLASVAIATNMDTHQPEVKKMTAKMFYARVLVGKSVIGHPKLRKPPPLYLNRDQFGKYFDSCVDNELNPKIYVIFDSNQTYPEYLLEYTYVD